MEEGVKRGRKTPQEASKGAQKGPQSSQNEPQRVQNWGLKVLRRVLGRNVRKTSKSTTLSSENRDFGGMEGRKWTRIRRKVDAEPFEVAYKVGRAQRKTFKTDFGRFLVPNGSQRPSN